MQFRKLHLGAAATSHKSMPRLSVALIDTTALCKHIVQTHLPIDFCANSSILSFQNDDLVLECLHLRKSFGHSEAEVAEWIGTWVGQGLAAVEQLIGDDGYCFGREPGLADVYLIPQLYAARRFSVPLDAYPRIRRVEALALDHPAFKAAHPSAQVDAE